MSNDEFKNIGIWLNSVIKEYNYQVAKSELAGKPGTSIKTMRQYRLQLINIQKDTSKKLIDGLKNILKDKNIKNVVFNPISPNSSKFSSYTFQFNNQKIDLVIARGPNKGENFEITTTSGLAKAFGKGKKDPSYAQLITQLNEANQEFAGVEIKSVKQRTGNTRKDGVSIEKLGEVVGDIVLTDTTSKKWYISLKATNGDTFSAYSGAASLFDSNGTLMPDSAGADFLNSFGVDLNHIQAAFDSRNKKKVLRPKIPVANANTTQIKAIFERAWGMNFFYVRKTTSSGWKVFWLDREKLNKLASNIVVTDIQYPNEKSKQLSIFCKNNHQEYVIELRNAKGGEYPNAIKFKVK